MEFFKQWALNVCVCSVVGTIISMLSPKGRMDKIIKLMLSVFIFMSVLTPIFNADKFENDFDISYETVAQDDLIEKSNEMTAKAGQKAIEEKIQSSLEENGFADCDVEAVLKKDNSSITVEKVYVYTKDMSKEKAISDFIKTQFDFTAEVKSVGQ